MENRKIPHSNLTNKLLKNQISIKFATLSFLTHLFFIVVCVLFSSRTFPIITGDSVTYQVDATNILENGAFSRESEAPFLWEPYRTPGYPLLIAYSKVLVGSEFLVMLFAAITAGGAAWAAVKLSEIIGAGKLGQSITGWTMALLPNSLGLSTFLLTDAIFGHLFLIWMYLIICILEKPNWKIHTFGAAFTLIGLQALKPTANIFFIFIIGAGLLWRNFSKKWMGVVSLSIIAILLPIIFSFMNFTNHGIFSPSLLGVQTAREYLLVRYEALDRNTSVTEMTRIVREEDLILARNLDQPSSIYGRLYMVEHQLVTEFFKSKPFTAAKLMLNEMVKQFIAPQEFSFIAFSHKISTVSRLIGSLLTIILWFGALSSCWSLLRIQQFELPILLVITILFFLTTGSISHFVGGRLRFPADLLAVPFFGYSAARWVEGLRR